MAGSRRPFAPLRNLNAKVAAVPMILTVLVVFVGCTLWTVDLFLHVLAVAANAGFRRDGSVRRGFSGHRAGPFR